jgi:alpha-mannosidase
MQVWSAPGMSKPTFEEAIVQLQNECRPYRVGDWLGKSWTNHWVKAELSVPDAFLQSEEEIICTLIWM